MGRQVTIMKPEVEDQFPKGPATVCVGAPQQKQCYTAPLDFGRNTSTVVVQLKQDTQALLFSAESGGVSGWSVHFALLVPGTGKELQNLFFPDMSFANQSQHAFWKEPSISRTPIFLVADYIWGPGEGHYGDHRFMISAYFPADWYPDGGLTYYLADRYMTTRSYDLDKSDILTTERPEILARLKRVAEANQRRLTPSHPIR